MSDDECLTSDQKNYIDMSIKVVEARIDGMDRAAVLKATEIDRRLMEHNELRKEVLTDRSVFLRKETYTLNMESLSEWRSRVDEKITTLMTNYQNRMSIGNWIAIAAVVVTIINLFVLIFFIN